MTKKQPDQILNRDHGCCQKAKPSCPTKTLLLLWPPCILSKSLLALCVSDPLTWSRRGALYLHKRRRAGWGPGSPRRPPSPPAPLRCGPRRPRQVPEHLGAEKPGPAWRKRAAAGLACRATPTACHSLPLRPGSMVAWKPLGPALACSAPNPCPTPGSRPSGRGPYAPPLAHPRPAIVVTFPAGRSACSARSASPATPPLPPPPHPGRRGQGFRALT